MLINCVRQYTLALNQYDSRMVNGHKTHDIDRDVDHWRERVDLHLRALHKEELLQLRDCIDDRMDKIEELKNDGS